METSRCKQLFFKRPHLLLMRGRNSQKCFYRNSVLLYTALEIFVYLYYFYSNIPFQFTMLYVTTHRSTTLVAISAAHIFACWFRVARDVFALIPLFLTTERKQKKCVMPQQNDLGPHLRCACAKMEPCVGNRNPIQTN